MKNHLGKFGSCCIDKLPSTHQMSINGKFSDITRDDLLKCGSRNNIRNAVRIIDELCQAASRWPEIARECEVPQKVIEAIRSDMLSPV